MTDQQPAQDAGRIIGVDTSKLTPIPESAAAPTWQDAGQGTWRKVKRDDLIPVRWQILDGDGYPRSICFYEADADAILEHAALTATVQGTWRVERSTNDRDCIVVSDDASQPSFYVPSWAAGEVAIGILNTLTATVKRLEEENRALRGRITTEESPPLSTTGLVLVQHRLSGFAAGLHPIGEACPTCAVLARTAITESGEGS